MYIIWKKDAFVSLSRFQFALVLRTRAILIVFVRLWKTHLCMFCFFQIALRTADEFAWLLYRIIVDFIYHLCLWPRITLVLQIKVLKINNKFRVYKLIYGEQFSKIIFNNRERNRLGRILRSHEILYITIWVESFHYLVDSTSVHSRRVNGHTNSMVNKNELLFNTRLQTRITFYFFKPFQDRLFPTYSTTIFLMNLFWTSCSRVDSSHLRQKSTSYSRIVWSCWLDSVFIFDSSRRTLRLETMTRLVTTLPLTTSRTFVARFAESKILIQFKIQVSERP
jgi:hypothetical protein